MTLTKFVRAGAVAASALLIASQANAADMYAGGGMKDAPIYAPPTMWTGFYVGSHVGAAWTELTTTDVNGQQAPAGKSWVNKDTNLISGGQLGYNLQYGSYVFGLEVDLGGINFSGKAREFPADILPASTMSGGFYFDVTGRLGYSFGSTLLYAKGGFAHLNAKIGRIDGADATKNRFETGLDGYTIGGGLEYAITPTWSVKSEYRYFDFSEDLLPNPGKKIENDLAIHTSTMSLNYHFNNDYIPLK
jgi:outer membrane immunogenic protein